MKSGNIIVGFIVLALGVGFAFCLSENRTLSDQLEVSVQSNRLDSITIHKQDVTIKDYANMNLKLRQAVTKSSISESALISDTAYINISSKYN